MARSDYAHWNEEADTMWWAEEGRFQGTDEERDYDPDDYLPGQDDDDDDDIADEPDPPEPPEDAYLDQIYEDRIVGDEW